MKLLLHCFCPRTLLDELLNQLKLLNTTSFETTGIMEDKTWVALKYHLVLDVMLSTLRGY